MDTKILPCGLTCMKESPRINSYQKSWNSSVSAWIDLVPGWIQSQSLMISRAEYGLSKKLLFVATGLPIDFG